jgi:hypothetical protein
MIVKDPNEVRAALEAPPAVAAEAKRDEVLVNITASYFFLRRGLAFIAIAFPFALWGLAGINDSLSAYYHCTDGVCAARGGGAGRDVLTGVLWAVGTFLFFYRGYTRKEDWALNLAGIAAAAVAFFPSDFARAEQGRSLVGKIHFTSGLVFFLAIAFVCLFCSGDTLKKLKNAAKVRRFKRAYAGLGTAMIAVPIGVFALHYLLDRPGRGYTVLGVELAGLFVFAAFWLVKSREIALIERQ